MDHHKFNHYSLHLLLLLVFVLHFDTITCTTTTSFNVLRYGANPIGKTDSSGALVQAWAAACATTDPTLIYIPNGRYLVGSPVIFTGYNCTNPNITIRIDGTLVGPADYRVLGEAPNWLSFQGVDGVSIVGGALDAKGTTLWACKDLLGNDCPIVNGATTLSFTNSKNIKLSGITSLNSQMFHIVINGCENVTIERVRVIAAGDSPNTDGIHVQLSSNVVITNTSIKTGDDCISIGPGTSNLWIERVRCGPGHGISIGSLGKDLEEEGVQNVTVKSTIFSDTTNGFRIKSWARASKGFVQNVRFIGAIMNNVQNPIIIDQHYCPHNLNCPTEVSGVKIEDVLYEGIRGSSATAIGIKLDCNSQYPCRGIRLQNVNLTFLNQTAQSSCVNALGTSLGPVQPDDCFLFN